jgi:hypothetical protein
MVDTLGGMKAALVDEGGLFVALALVPGFASRNRHPELYEGVAGKRARMRARRLRAFLVAASEADEASVTFEGGNLSARVVRHEPRSSWTLLGDALDGAVCRYLLARGGVETAAQRALLEALPVDSDGPMNEALEAMRALLAITPKTP